METLWNVQDRRMLARRVASLKPNTAPQWGKMSPSMALEHLGIALRVTMGEVEAKPRSGPLRFPPLRTLIIYVLPFPKSVPTAPEYIVEEEGNFDARQAEMLKLMNRCSAYPRERLAEHPAFGKLNEADWGRLHWRHIDHHLRQFGV